MFRTRLQRHLVVFCLVSGALYACSGDDDNTSSSSTATGPQVHGKVTAPGGAPLEGVTVTAGGATTTTDASGIYTLKAAAGAAVVAFSKTGYTDGHERLTIGATASTQLDATLLAVPAPTPIDATAGGTVSTTRGAKVVVPANALVDKSGAPVTGMVDVSLTPIDPSDADELRAAPGDFQASQTGQPTMLESLGMVEITIRRGTEKLQVAPGKTLELRIPAPASLASPPATSPIWSFNESTGVWVDEGTATYDAATRTYVLQAPHMSTWNCDQPYLATCVCGTVYDKAGGGALAGARVVSVGTSYLGSSEASTDDKGHFCIAVKKDSDVDVAAYHKSGGGQSRAIHSGSADTSVPPTAGDPRCVDVGRWDVEREIFVSSSGTATTCDAVSKTFDNTCASKLGEALGSCYQPSGACTIDLGGSYSSGITISYANGAKMTTDPAHPGVYTYINASGKTCLTVEASGTPGGTVTAVYKVPSGETFTFEEGTNGSIAFKCANGQTTTITPEQQEAFQACAPQTDNSSSTPGNSCTIVNAPDAGYTTTGNSGEPCTTDATCTGGTICCTTNTDSQYCFTKQTCDLLKQ